MKTQAIALKTRLFESGGTASSVFGAIGSVHNVCHSLCVTVVSIAAIFGITLTILPLMFLQTYQLYFWWAAFVFTIISFYFYLRSKELAHFRQIHKSTFDRNLLTINFGMLTFGLPLSGLLADYMDVFRFFGIALALSGLFLLLFGKRFKTVYRPVHLGGVHSATPEVKSEMKLSQLPKFSVSSILFAIVIGGFLVNQYFMWQLTRGGKVSVSSSPGSVMQKVSNMKLSPFDVVLAKERMDKNNDGICDVCGMSIDQCISSGQIDCNMGNQKDAIGVLGSQHIHADWKIYINGQPFDWSTHGDLHERLMKGDASVTNTSAFIHMHPAKSPEKAGDILHMHASNVPLWLFFKSIGMKLDKDGLTLADGTILKNEGGNTLKFYLNGKKIDELGSYIFQDLDKLLISYGPENDPDIERQIGSVTNFAKDH